MTFENAGTLSKIVELCKVTAEGDRVRVLKFCEAIRECRQGKKEARVARHASPKAELQ